MSPEEFERDRMLAVLLSKIERMEEANHERDKRLESIQGRVGWLGMNALAVGCVVGFFYGVRTIEALYEGLERWLWIAGLAAFVLAIWALHAKAFLSSR